MSVDELMKLYDSAVKHIPGISHPYLDLLWDVVAYLIPMSLIVILLRRSIPKSVSKNFTKGFWEVFSLPEPYPKLERFFSVIFMLVGYGSFLIFSILAVFVCIGLIFHIKPTSIKTESEDLLCLAGCVVFAWVFFAQAERDRLKLKGEYCPINEH